MSLAMQYCCESMQRHIEYGEFEYHPSHRCICCFFRRRRRNEGYGQRMLNFCPFCGTKLPDNLYNKYPDELEKAVGKDFCDITEDEIPEEFKTDEWWKKRGL